MPSLALACRLSAATAAIRSLFSRAKSIARRYNEPLLAIEDDFLELGPELITNGDFSNGTTGWTSVGSTITESAGQLVVTLTGAGFGTALSAASIPLTVGKQYQLQGYCDSSASFRLNNVTTGTAIAVVGAPAAGGQQSIVFTATESAAIVGLYTNLNTAGSVRRFDSISVREILSAQVYQDSAGTLPATVGSPIGLLTDRAYGGELGVELVANGGFDSADGWTLSSNATAVAPTISGGKLIFNSPSPDYMFCRRTLNADLVIGKSYEISVNCLAYTAGTFQVAVLGGTASVAISGINATGIKKVVFYATSANTSVEIYRLFGSSNYVAEFDNISVRELKGNHATQATAGNRPILAQVPKRLGVELILNGDGSSLAGWNIANSIASIVNDGGESVISLSAAGGASNINQTPTLEVGKSYAVSLKRRGVVLGGGLTGRLQVLYADGEGEMVPATSVAVSATYETVNRVVTVAKPVSMVRMLATVSSGDTVGTVYFDNISVREVLEWTPAASFNGTTNSLQLATNPIGSNISQPYTIIVAGVVGALGATRSLCGDSARNPKITSDGKLLIGHNGNDGRSGASVLSQGQAFVAAMFWDGSVVTIELNGVPYLSSALDAPITPAASFFIGQRGNNSEFFNGQITGIAVFDRVLTDSERTTIGKAFAKELGVTYLG